MAIDVPRAQLIHIESARRLGLEWHEADAGRRPSRGACAPPPGLFSGYAALALVVLCGAAAGVLFLLSPRLAALAPALPRAAGWALAGAFGLAALWLAALAASFYGGVALLPERLLERGPFLQLMNLTSRVARLVGRRDWVEHAAIDVYNALAEHRGRKVGKGELLVLIPRCLSKQALDGVLSIAGRYEVPVFVATRGQLARRVIRERRPRAVVAVACERDMMTGLRDVAGKLPVLGLTMRLANGPCRDAMIDLDVMETWVRGLVGA